MKLKIMRSGIKVSEMTIKFLPSNDHEIAYLWTATEHRGKGLASMLLERAKSKYPVLVAFLDDDGTGLNNAQMEAWYKRHGFKKIRYDLGMSSAWDSGRWAKCMKWVMYYST